MNLLLDTNVLLWTLAGSARIRPIQELILSNDSIVHVTTVSWWEIAIKASIGKLEANIADLRKAALDSGFVELPVLGEHTEMLSSLVLHHRDPFDRMIVAQALAEPMRLLTGDSKLGMYSELVQVI
ncbi:MAG: type II toxin-antitoxin system VapC family toxin [Sterolibacterium sp.]|jgi:PIN domain nuclease of toxin-antitoxin system|nr:type II toxin-antitoxin system VapC family toxin [Sterolibacterium sp.]